MAIEQALAIVALLLSVISIIMAIYAYFEGGE